MPFKSEAQRRKMTEKLNSGEISQEQFAEMAAGTPDVLPERLHPKKYEFTLREKAMLLQALKDQADEPASASLAPELTALISKLEAE